MQKFTFHRQKTGLFTDQQNQLAYSQDQLHAFIGGAFSKESFEEQIQIKRNNFKNEQRENLVLALKKKYATVEKSAKVEKNLDILSFDTTFTITTGHQLSIFTGPVYLIYKIMHVIRLTEELKQAYPEYNFVPVYWMASEDHDFEEIQSVDVFNRTLTWETDQKGAVGRFETEGLEKLKSEIISFFENHPDCEVEKMLDAYKGESLGEATFKLIHHLFDKYGLIIVDADESDLKKEFIPIFEKEIKDQFSFKAVHKTNESIVREGLKVQVNAREINLFYLGDQMRERILHLDEGFFIEGKGKLSLEQLLFELNQYPERFSPNVILRPVFQEYILPNLCYVGGVGEISYWLQLKGVFEALDLPYPLIQPRTSILWIDSVMSKKIDKAGISLEDLFQDETKVKNQYLKEYASDDVDFSTLNNKSEELKNVLLERITAIDPSLDKYAHAEIVRLEKQLDGIKEKLIKTIKQRHETGMKTIEQVFDRLFPNGGMQERSLNFISMCADGNVFSNIDRLHSIIEPFDPDFIIIRE